MNTEHVHVNDVCRVQNCISWSAIIIGALIAVGLGFLLNLFAMAIGLSAFSYPTDTGSAVFAIGGFLGMLIGIIAVLATAGFASGYLGRFSCPGKNLGVIYGFATWTLALILSACIAGGLSKYAGVYVHGAAGVASENTISYMTPKVGATENKVTNQQNAQADVKKQLQPDHSNIMHLSDAAWMMFIAFILFFIGALACCFGAYMGMGCCNKEEKIN